MADTEIIKIVSAFGFLPILIIAVLYLGYKLLAEGDFVKKLTKKQLWSFFLIGYASFFILIALWFFFDRKNQCEQLLSRVKFEFNRIDYSENNIRLNAPVLKQQLTDLEGDIQFLMNNCDLADDKRQQLIVTRDSMAQIIRLLEQLNDSQR